MICTIDAGVSRIGLFTPKFQTAFKPVVFENVVRQEGSKFGGFRRSPHPSIHFPVESLRSITSFLACPPVNSSLGYFHQRELKVAGGCLECVASPRNQTS